MTLRDLVRSACLGLLQQKLRTLLTVGGVTLGAMLLFCSVSGRLGVLGALQERLAIGDRLLRINVRSGHKPPPKDALAEIEKRIPPEVEGNRRKRLAELIAMKSPSKGSYVRLTLPRLKEIRQLDGVKEAVPDIAFRSEALIQESIRTLRVHSASASNQSIASLIVQGSTLSSNSADEILISEAYLYELGLRTEEEFKGIIGNNMTLGRFTSTGRLPDEELALTQASIKVRERILKSDGSTMPQEQRELLQTELRQFRQKLTRHQQAQRSEIQSQPLRIVGIYRSPPKGFQSDAALIDAFYNNALVPPDTLAEYRLFVYPGRAVNRANSEVNATVICEDAESAKHILNKLKTEGFTCTSYASLAVRIRSSVLIVTAIVTAIAAAAFLIAALGMTNTMVMNVLERRREIGILKSIGAKDRDILQMFLTEGLIVGLLGGALGLLLGTAFTLACEDYMRAFLERRLDESLRASLFVCPTWLVVATPTITSVVTVLASTLPARKASKLDPVRTLRNL